MYFTVADSQCRLKGGPSRLWTNDYWELLAHYTVPFGHCPGCKIVFKDPSRRERRPPRHWRARVTVEIGACSRLSCRGDHEDGYVVRDRCIIYISNMRLGFFARHEETTEKCQESIVCRRGCRSLRCMCWRVRQNFLLPKSEYTRDTSDRGRGTPIPPASTTKRPDESRYMSPGMIDGWYLVESMPFRIVFQNAATSSSYRTRRAQRNEQSQRCRGEGGIRATMFCSTTSTVFVRCARDND